MLTKETDGRRIELSINDDGHASIVVDMGQDGVDAARLTPDELRWFVVVAGPAILAELHAG